jgi:NAD(P)-dependent dehydrogenase (short-subunit alcohol dehydrogenase family)
LGPFDVTGKRVLVTGGSRGIGYAVGRAFAAGGAEVVLLSSSAEVLSAADRLAQETGRPVEGVRCDVADRAAVYQKVGALGRLDVLINNAGVCEQTPLDGPRDAVDAEFERILAVNLSGQFYVTRAALPLMGRGGAIVFTGSLWSTAAGANYAAYCVSKHGLLGMTRSLAHELGPRGITVNAVLPGTIHTEMNVRNITEEVRRQVVSAMVMNRGWIEPEDIAPLFVFFATAAAKDITGQSVHINRGQIMV